ncbi:MAG TPA: cell division protein FtsL [Deltaproteobacteria bacterium]|nr:cell division protein FtsL [Deltaproteobacteria bacterium]
MHTAGLRTKAILKEQNVRFKRALEDRSFLYTALITVFLIALVILVYLWCRLTVVNLGYEISRLNMERKVALEENRRLKIELSRLKSPQRIEKIARKMGLVYPREDQIVRIK